MLDHPCRVLLIEDHPEDIERTTSMLANANSATFPRGFELEFADTLAAGKKMLDRQEFDVVLLDLILPDSRGMTTLKAIEEVAHRVPIIVETALEDEVVAVKALESGACGYVPKVLLDDNLILYAIRTAIERKRQLGDKVSPQENNEIDVLERLNTEIHHQDCSLPKVESLFQRMPDIFEEFKERYDKLFSQIVEQKLYKVKYDIDRELNVLVEQLGYLQATPKDAIELHMAILKQKQAHLGQTKARIFIAEGRYLLLEVIGKLAAYYQRYYIGLSKINLSHSYNKVSSKEDT